MTFESLVFGAGRFRPCLRRHKRSAQSGMTLISVLASLLIFSLGLLGVAKLYFTLMSAHISNEQLTALQTVGDRFGALTQAHPEVLSGILGGAGSGTLTVNKDQLSSVPTQLRPYLSDLFADLGILSGASAVITLGPDAAGTACSVGGSAPDVCGVTLAITWTVPGGIERTQTFMYQVGGV